MMDMPPDQQAEQKAVLADLVKQLRKRERRLLERLQKAQAARAKAVERLNRAQARLQKRTARLQRLEERLSLLRRQLQALTSPPGAPAVTPPAEAGQEEPLSTAVSPELPAAERSEEVSTPASAELDTLTGLLAEEAAREEQLRQSLLATGAATPAEAELPAHPLETPFLPAEGEPPWIGYLLAEELQQGATAPDLEQAAPAPEPPEAAEAAEEITAGPASIPAQERLHQAALYGFDEPPELPEAETAPLSEPTPEALQMSLLPATPAELVREARAAAEAAEEAARLATARAALAAARLEQLPAGRHLSQELAEAEQAAAQASRAAQLAEETAREVERWAQTVAPSEPIASASAAPALPEGDTATDGEMEMVAPAELPTPAQEATAASAAAEPAMPVSEPEEAETEQPPPQWGGGRS